MAPAQVYRFERLQPLSYYAAAEQMQPMTGLLWGAKDTGEEALRARCQMVRCASGPWGLPQQAEVLHSMRDHAPAVPRCKGSTP